MNKMTIQALQWFIIQIHTQLSEQHGDLDPMQRKLCSLTKLTEEVGELNRAVLGHYGRQRQGNDRDAIGEIGPECADVIFAAMMVARDFDIDIGEELERKKEKIEKRFQI